ncbi:MAG: ATP-binding protein [Bacteroidales bacterium]|jgi:predicted AAA+ superfamily ATPase|nr:ATP-binding protein [Bacteroidales bacterium]
MEAHKKKYISRPYYLQKALPFLDKNLIKVLTGQRRTGKSYIMLQLMDEIIKENPEAQIIFIDKELMEFDFIKSAKDLMDYLNRKIDKDKRTYLFIDEIQEIDEFEKGLRSLLNEGIADIWCSGSNADILTGELADRLSGRYIEIRIHSLNYTEFLEFHSLTNDNQSLQLYLKFGGLPNLINLPLEDDIVFDYLKSINATVLLKDVIKRHQIRSVSMLENLIRFMVDNTGSLFSASSISKFLKSQGQKISPSVISNYISYILDSYYLIKVPRSDLQGKRIFEINEKYFFEDLGLRNAWTGYQAMHINKLIENVVFKHLLVQGFKISVGSVGDKEIDFVAEKYGTKIYVQCAYLLSNEKIRKREFGNLMAIKDNHRKIVVSMDEVAGGNLDGIEHLDLKEFLSIIL